MALFRFVQAKQNVLVKIRSTKQKTSIDSSFFSNRFCISKIGARILRLVTSGKCISLSRGGNSQRLYCQYLIPKVLLLCGHRSFGQCKVVQSKPKVFENFMFQRHHFFTGADEGREETEEITVTFVEKDGKERHIKVPIGMSMLEAALDNDIQLEGACGGSLQCSTCHVIVTDVEYYNKLDDPTDEEYDVLDLITLGPTETSRMGCQVIASVELDGLRLALPDATSNFLIDKIISKRH